MLSDEAIADWSLVHPWDEPQQVEQDLLLEGILHEVASASRAASLAFIGGTCLHKLYAPQSQRYSEDLDFTWLDHDPPDDALEEIATSCETLGFDKTEIVTSAEARFPKVLCYYTKTGGSPGKIKLEVNRQQASELRASLVSQTLTSANPWLNATSEIHCAPLPSLAGMKIVAGSVRGKVRDLHDLDYMLNQLGVSSDEAMAWAQRLRPPDWKPARRHRFVKRTVRKPAYWLEMNSYLPASRGLKGADQQRMASGMLKLLADMQKPDKPARGQDDPQGKSHGEKEKPPTRLCGHGTPACRRRVAPGKKCPVHKKPPKGRRL